MIKIRKDHGTSIPFTLTGVRDYQKNLVTSFVGWQLWFTLKLAESGWDDPDPGILQYTIGNGISHSAGTAWWDITDTFSRQYLLPEVDYLWHVQGREPLTQRLDSLEKGTLILNKKLTKSY